MNAKPNILILSTIGVCFTLLAACGKKAELKPVPPRPVVTHTVEAPSSQITRRFSGQVNSAEGTGISFEVNGRVVEVIAKSGRQYEAGASLARINDTDFRNQLSDAQATFTQAEQELRRVQRLYESQNASQSQLDGAIAQEQSAEANFKRAQKAVNDCTLRMPYAGVIGRVNVDAQQVISAGQSVITIQGDGGLEFEMGVPAEDVASLYRGMPAEITLGAFRGKKIGATVISISPEVSDNTTYPVTLGLVKDDTEAISIRPGLDGEAAIALPNPLGSVLRVPSASIAAAPDGTHYVWVVQPTSDKLATVSKRIVEIRGLAPGNMIEVVSGLTAGDIIVTRGVHSLEADITVALEN